MNYSEFLKMVPEAVLVAILIAVFIGDFVFCKSARKNALLSKLTGVMLLGALVLLAAASGTEPVSAFGGLYVTSKAVNVMKTILTLGSLIVVLMSQPWLESEKMQRLQGEFYMLLLSTLLGMFIMMSSGNFLLFFLGLETASVPLACMVALDKWKQNSAEGAAKYILVATFSSGVMLYGISFIYAAVGTLYFDDVAATITVSPLAIMGLVFFFSGLGFKISLVPFHFWTADTYEGAPTPVTGYLSVISKGAAALTLCIILMKVFQPRSHRLDISCLPWWVTLRWVWQHCRTTCSSILWPIWLYLLSSTWWSRRMADVRTWLPITASIRRTRNCRSS